MNSTSDQTADNELLVPSAIYAMNDIQRSSLPSTFYAPDELSKVPLSPIMASLQTDTCCDTAGVADIHEASYIYQDGRTETVQQTPDHYAYTPFPVDTWEDGLQAIDDYDWATTKDTGEEGETAQSLISGTSLEEKPGLPILLHSGGSLQDNDIKISENLTHPAQDITQQTTSWKIASPPNPPRVKDYELMTEHLPFPTSDSCRVVEFNLALAALVHETNDANPQPVTGFGTEPRKDINISTVDVDAEIFQASPTRSNALPICGLVLQGHLHPIQTLSVGTMPQIDTAHQVIAAKIESGGHATTHNVVSATTDDSNDSHEDQGFVMLGDKSFTVLYDAKISEASYGQPAQRFDLLAPPTINSPVQPNVAHEQRQDQNYHHQWGEKLQETTVEENLGDRTELLPLNHIESRDAKDDTSVPGLNNLSLGQTDGFQAPMASSISRQEQKRGNGMFDHQHITHVDTKTTRDGIIQEIIHDTGLCEQSSLSSNSIPTIYKIHEAEDIHVKDHNEGAPQMHDENSAPHTALTHVTLVPAAAVSETSFDKLPIPEKPEYIPVAVDISMHTKLTGAELPLDTGGEASVGRSMEMDRTSAPITAYLEEGSDRIEKPVITPSLTNLNYREPMSSPKEIPKYVEKGTGTTLATNENEELVGSQTSKRETRSNFEETIHPSIKDSSTKQAETYLEEDIGPTEDDQTAQMHSERVENEALHIQKHYCDAEEFPSNRPGELLNTRQRNPKNGVSIRELAALGSTLAPSMHLGLHLRSDAPLVRVRNFNGTYAKNVIADDSFLPGEKETPEYTADLTLPITKRKRAAVTTSEEVCTSKKAKVEASKQKATRRRAPAIKQEQRNRVATEERQEDGQELLLTPLDQGSRKSTATATDTDDEYLEVINTKTKNNKNTSRLPTVLKARNASSAPRSSPSVASAGSLPARNKWGFSQKVLRSRKSTDSKTPTKPRSVAKAKAAAAIDNASKPSEMKPDTTKSKGITPESRAAKDRQAHHAATVAPEPGRRTTRRASAIAVKEANIGKRLRSKD
jgi:hypothetical protein